MQRFWKVLADHEEPSCGAGAEWGRDGGQALSLRRVSAGQPISGDPTAWRWVGERRACRTSIPI